MASGGLVFQPLDIPSARSRVYRCSSAGNREYREKRDARKALAIAKILYFRQLFIKAGPLFEARFSTNWGPRVSQLMGNCQGGRWAISRPSCRLGELLPHLMGAGGGASTGEPRGLLRFLGRRHQTTTGGIGDHAPRALWGMSTTPCRRRTSDTSPPDKARANNARWSFNR